MKKPKSGALSGLSFGSMLQDYAQGLGLESSLNDADDGLELLTMPQEHLGRPHQSEKKRKAGKEQQQPSKQQKTEQPSKPSKQQKTEQPSKPSKQQKTEQLETEGKQQHSQAKLKPDRAGRHDLKGPDGTAAASASRTWAFKVDYNDHFETGADALAHADSVLTCLARHLGKPKSQLIIYDPYYCTGSVVQQWKQQGYTHVINRNRDFYADVAAKQVPDYDVLVTNPPYSSDHKERILSFCLSSGKPWMLLMPNYVANKQYYASALTDAAAAAAVSGSNRQHKRAPHEQLSPKQQHKHSTDKGSRSPTWQPPFYLVPSIKYEYTHPEGTGHTSSPFFSIWYVHLGQYTARACDAVQVQASKTGTPAGVASVRVVSSVEGLRQGGAAPAHKRPNPRQRKKMKALTGQKQ